MRKKKITVYIAEFKCPVCDKTFIPAPMHAYKDRRSRKNVCSWSCVLKSEKLKQDAMKKKGATRNENRLD